MSGACSPSVDSQADVLHKYHEYLDANYTGGLERFFSPTGVLDRFQRCVAVSAERTRRVVTAKSMEDAVAKLQPVVSGGEGVFDLTAEPGSGKTSVLPFRFPAKRVVVAMPTPFDAWSAFQMATGDAMLRLKGLTLGVGKRVCYTDSYLAANMLLSGFLEYDVMIVDECDSGKGVTGFLAEVRAPGKVLVRMSATHGRTAAGPSRAFAVTEDSTLPDVRSGVEAFALAAVTKASGRSLVLVPDAATAAQVAEEISGAKLVSSVTGLRALAETMVDQTNQGLFVADDVCARGLNLNLDVLIDSQLVTEHGVTRHLTEAELCQRKGRVGRNKPGWYVSPGLATMAPRVCDADVFRVNVMRAFAGIDQLGPPTLRVDSVGANELLCSAVEPLSVHRLSAVVRSAQACGNDSELNEHGNGLAGSRTSSVDGRGRRRSRTKSVEKKERKNTVAPPSWFSWMMPFGAVEKVDGKRYYVSEVKSLSVVPRAVLSRDSSLSVSKRHSRHHSKDLAVAEAAPYAVVPKREFSVREVGVNVPVVPPVVDLTELEYHMDWPSLVRDRVASGAELPTIVPPGNWRHTSAGGMGTNWVARLEGIAVNELTFVESEFEVVCRAWNKIVAQAWVRRTPGLSSLDNEDRIEFCVRYFQSYFQMYSL